MIKSIRQAARPCEDLRHQTSSEVERSDQTPGQQELERFVRHLRMPPESDGITSNTFGRSSATTISHTRATRLTILQLCIESFGSHICGVDRQRASSDAREPLRKLTGFFGIHRGLRAPRNLRIPQNAFGYSPASHHSKPGCFNLRFRCTTQNGKNFGSSPRKASAFHRNATAFPPESLGLPTVRDDSQRVSPDTHGSLRAPRIS